MPPPTAPFKNHLLSSLDPEDLKLLTPHLQLLELRQRTVLFEVGAPFDAIYFMEDGVASVLTTLENGASIEVGMIEMEGLASVSALLGDDVSTQQIVVQLAGSAQRIGLAPCRAAFQTSLGFRRAALRFASFFLNFSAQSAACNSLHSVEQRLSRWLLMSNDRFQSNTLPLTQEYLSAMLGVRRAGISETAIALQRAGLIRYNHGQITIIDRAGLERAACECYAMDHERFHNLIQK